MWSRSQLKDRAKWVLKQCYWKAVLMSLILVVISGGSYAINSVSTNKELYSQSYNSSMMGTKEMEILMAVVGAFFAVTLIVAIIAILVRCFLFSPLEVSIRRFFIISRVQPAELGELGFAFKKGYMNIVKIQFLRGLFTTLWSFLLIIPGIIKSYEYRMIPYILAENPEMDSKEVFRISKDMMYGEKWDTFVLDLSFIGWNILNAFTCGILGVFYVSPYMNLTFVELYDALKGKLFGNGGNAANGAYNENAAGDWN